MVAAETQSEHHWSERWLKRYGPALLAATALLFPLKLSFAYAAAIPLILLWMARALYRRTAELPSVAVPLFALIGYAALSAFFGIEPYRSLPKFLNLTFFACMIPATAAVVQLSSWRRVVVPLVVGQCIAALHSVAEGGMAGDLARIFLGKVTESGQLGLVIPAALGMAFLSAGDPRRLLAARPGAVIFGALVTLLCIAIGFAPTLHLTGSLLISAAAILFLALLTVISRSAAEIRSSPERRTGAELLGLNAVALPLLTAALLINLKRGPWVGVFIALAILFLLYSRRLLLLLLSTPIVMLIFVDPIRERLFASAEHFFIAGGRNTMWKIGGELALRYPLGIGYHNSPFLRHFALDIPPEHTHFHNNFLNILVETGWLGLGLFLWWLSRILVVAFGAQARAHPRAPLLAAIGCAVVSWQVAGLVEYNFGDSEVVNIAYLLVGLLAAETSIKKS